MSIDWKEAARRFARRARNHRHNWQEAVGEVQEWYRLLLLERQRTHLLIEAVRAEAMDCGCSERIEKQWREWRDEGRPDHPLAPGGG